MKGRLTSWHDSGYGMVYVSLTEKYFLHASNVIEAPAGLVTPPKGCVVEFDVAPPYRGGRFPQAINARVTLPEVSGAIAGEVSNASH